MYSLLGNMLASSASQYMLIAAAIMIPTVWLPDLSALSFLGVFGVTATTTVVASVLYTLVTGNFTAGALTHSALPATLPLVFGIMTFCYSGHGVFPAIQASMKEPQLFPKVLNVAFFLVAFLCTFIAAAGYYMYGAGAADIVIFNLPTLLATACSCLVLINPVAKFALTMEPVAAAANVAAGAGRPLTGLPRLAVRTALSLAILMAARSLPFLAHLMALVGSFMTISVSVTLPALCHLILLKGKLGTAKVLWNWFVVLLGVTCTVAGTTASMRSLAAKASAVAVGAA
ncbi:Aa_trans domain-containing protein, partial [Haematococcus lacustris]